MLRAPKQAGGGRNALLLPEIVDFLEGGCALIVGTVAPDGEPHVGRGWGLTVLPGDSPQFRLLLAANDAVTIEHLAPGGRIAITGADVPTLRSMQVKGRSLGIESATEPDRERARAFMDAFFGDIVDTDGIEHSTVARIAPPDVVACVVLVDELYDQTPGPGAGASMAGASA
jgi:hypothetical protein